LLTPYQHHVSNLDKELSKYPALNDFERQTSIPKVYVVIGLLALYFFLVFFNIAGEFLVNFAGFVVPGYYSLEALFSASKTDDTQVSSPFGMAKQSVWRP
jgi:receptor expression-enhancing protein 5/6